jgi:hypothetical protein
VWVGLPTKDQSLVGVEATHSQYFWANRGKGWGCESPAKRNELDFRKLPNFWDGQTNIGDSNIDLNVNKKCHPIKKHLEKNTSSAIFGKEKNLNYERWRK